jgi:hypothetical protein
MPPDSRLPAPGSLRSRMGRIRGCSIEIREIRDRLIGDAVDVTRVRRLRPLYHSTTLLLLEYNPWAIQLPISKPRLQINAGNAAAFLRGRPLHARPAHGEVKLVRGHPGFFILHVWRLI